MRKPSKVFIMLTIVILVMLPAFSCISSSSPEEPQGPAVQQVPTEPKLPEEEVHPPPPTEIPPMYSEEEILMMVQEKLLGFKVDPFLEPREIIKVECFVDGYDLTYREWTGSCFLWVEGHNAYVRAYWNLLEESGDMLIRGHFREGEYHIPGP